jgi:hypothetical protein
MSMQLRRPRPAVASRRLKKSRGPIAAALVAALVLVPSASSGTYTDPAGDSSTAGDITAVTVMGDKASGQLLFKITGTNIASSDQNPLFLDIDSDANPVTGDITDNGADYSFYVDDTSYGFAHWDGTHWVLTSDLSVRVTGGTSQILISVNRSEVGNTSMFNFFAWSVSVPDRVFDNAPNEGAFNYSFEANGPDITSVDVQTKPAAGPKAGKKFVIIPAGLKLPPDGRTTTDAIRPESYSCIAKLGARPLTASGTGGCTITVPKKKARGKKLTVQLTVIYEGATKAVPLTFKVS